MGAVKDFYISYFEPCEDPEQERKHLEEEKAWEAEARESAGEPCPIARAAEQLRLKKDTGNGGNPSSAAS